MTDLSVVVDVPGYPPTPATASVRSSPTVKPRTIGMRDRNGVPCVPGAPVSVHVNVSAIAPDHTRINLDPLKNALDRARAAGAGGCVLSLDGGVRESDDAKAFFGAVHLADPQNPNTTYDSVAFWTPEYQARAEEIVAATVELVEPDPLVREYLMWWNGTQFSHEWPIRQAAYKPNITAYYAAGYDADVDIANIVAAPAVLARYLRSTRFATWVPMDLQHMQPNGTMRQDAAVTTAFLDQVVALHPDAVLGIDNSDRTVYPAPRTGVYRTLLTYHQQHGMARADQTATAAKVGGPAAVQQLFDPTGPYLPAMVGDGVFTQEYPVGSGMTRAQFQAAHDYMTAAAEAS